MSEVNHPEHYNSHPSGVECIDVVEHMTFNLGNAVKYIWRADLKGNTVQDLDKAIWYIQREKQRIRDGQNDNQRAEQKEGSSEEFTFEDGDFKYLRIDGVKPGWYRIASVDEATRISLEKPSS